MAKRPKKGTAEKAVAKKKAKAAAAKKLTTAGGQQEGKTKATAAAKKKAQVAARAKKATRAGATTTTTKKASASNRKGQAGRATAQAKAKVTAKAKAATRAGAPTPKKTGERAGQAGRTATMTETNAPSGRGVQALPPRPVGGGQEQRLQRARAARMAAGRAALPKTAPKRPTGKPRTPSTKTVPPRYGQEGRLKRARAAKTLVKPPTTLPSTGKNVAPKKPGKGMATRASAMTAAKRRKKGKRIAFGRV